MTATPGTARNQMPTVPEPATHGVWCLVGVCVAGAWTGIGCAIAALQHDARTFVQEWASLQGFFLMALGTWLLLIIRSGTLKARVTSLTADASMRLGILQNHRLRAGIVAVIGILGTASLIPLGFPARSAVLFFMWITCALVCLAAGAATLHTIEIVVAIHGLARTDIRTFRYAPARTPELRSIVSYFSSFTLLVTIGYACAVLATLDNHWTGAREYISAVRLFWPIIYVPVCSVAMFYPHIVVHQIIQREKQKTLLSCEHDIDDLLIRFRDLKTEDINRTNNLAQLFDRIAATPNYVVDFSIAATTMLPLLVNVVSFFAKAVFTHGKMISP